MGGKKKIHLLKAPLPLRGTRAAQEGFVCVPGAVSLGKLEQKPPAGIQHCSSLPRMQRPPGSSIFEGGHLIPAGLGDLWSPSQSPAWRETPSLWEGVRLGCRGASLDAVSCLG